MIEVLLVILALLVLVAGPAAFFTGLATRTRLRALEANVAALRQGFAPPASQLYAPYGAPYGAPAGPPAPPPPGEEIFRPGQTATPPDVPPTKEPAAQPGMPSGPPPLPGTVPPGAIPPRPSPPPTAPSAGPGLEERLGTRWVVWVGGLALALGGIFLVRYSIEQGLIGPGTRIVLGMLLALALIAGGEWTRRKEGLSALAKLPQASIPAILTAAGTTAAYATVWSAYGLYEFLSAPAAFVLLGIVALATLAAALLHGPALAGLGLVGAYVTPLLVSSDAPNFYALYLYLAVVTAAAFALARVRLWRWLAITAVAFSVFWLFPGLANLADATPHALHVTAGFVLAALLIVSGLAFGSPAEPDSSDAVSSGALAAYALAAAVLVVAGHHAALPLGVFAVLTFAIVAIAWRTPAAALALPAAAALAALVIAEWAVAWEWETLVAPAGVTAEAIPHAGRAYVGMHVALGAAFAALFGGAGYLAQGRYAQPQVPLLWAGSAVLAPVGILVALYYGIVGFEQSIPFAGLALLLAALYAVAVEMLGRREPRAGLASAQALFAVGAVASLALTLTFALEKGWLTVALALTAPGIAWISTKRPLPLLRWLAAGIAVAVSARVLWEPRIVADVGATPIFNWLLWGYGVPALSFWVAATLLRRRADDLPARMLESAAILYTALTAQLEVRHYVGHGDIYLRDSGLTEIGLDVSILLALSIGLERVRGRTASLIHNVGAVLTADLALVLIVGGLLFFENPLIMRIPVGPPVINLILLCYGMPAVLAATLALIAKDTRSMPYRAVLASAAVVLALSYLTLQVRRLFQGETLDILFTNSSTSDAELWTYSAVWLAFGVALLLIGILLRSPPARLASAAVILCTVFKVFLFDLAGIGGVWRALSFIGLGLVLVGIGWLYQRLLFPRLPGPSVPQNGPAGGSAGGGPPNVIAPA